MLFIGLIAHYEIEKLTPVIKPKVLKTCFQDYIVDKKYTVYSGQYLELRSPITKQTTIIKVEKRDYDNYLVADTIK